MTGYDPNVSGPWSDVDSHPRVYTPPPKESANARKARIAKEEQQRRAHLESVMAQWDEWQPEEKRDNAYDLARKLREYQPTWADGEECGVSVAMLRDALVEVGLRLVDAQEGYDE